MPITHEKSVTGVFPLSLYCLEHYMEKSLLTRWPLLNMILFRLRLMPHRKIQTDVIYLAVEGSGLFLMNGIPMKIVANSESYFMYNGLNVRTGENVIECLSGHEGPAQASSYSGVDIYKV